MQLPASNLRPDRFHRLIRDCRAEVNEVLPRPILRSPRPKRIPQKIEFLVRIRPSPIIILAIDDFRLLRMKLQPTLPHACGYRDPNLLGFRFRSAMHDGVVGETLKWKPRIALRHPSIVNLVEDRYYRLLDDLYPPALRCPRDVGAHPLSQCR